MRQTDQRVRMTRHMIKKTFTELLQQKPLREISVRELCEKAGINRGTFYAHYQDMYDLLEQLENDMLEDFAAALRPLLEAGDGTPLAITTGVFRCIQENADICAVTLGPYGDKAFAARLLQLGRQGCMESYLRRFEKASPRQIEYYYAFVSAGCIGLLEKWMADGMTQDAQEIAAMAEGIMLQGIGFLTRGETQR